MSQVMMSWWKNVILQLFRVFYWNIFLDSSFAAMWCNRSVLKIIAKFFLSSWSFLNQLTELECAGWMSWMGFDELPQCNLAPVSHHERFMVSRELHNSPSTHIYELQLNFNFHSFLASSRHTQKSSTLSRVIYRFENGNMFLFSFFVQIIHHHQWLNFRKFALSCEQQNGK